MRLVPGSTLGPYQILAPLGAGGMGEVYKARDTRLGREVAVKILPADRMADEERKRRFIQEARAASALNHPNIVTIHDISQADGTDFLVMEYVRGKTLDQLIGRSGMRVSEALRCASQIADALAKAHAAGIVHRDLKPGNVMVNEDGAVKVLDFGLAKLAEPAKSAQDASTRTITKEGDIVGTVSYMSPEQAEGKNVDARSDIFSFGSMLYEMVTGRRAFFGDSPAFTLAAVLKEDPSPPSQIAAVVPKELERIILRCLRKDPARRFQIAADLKVELEEVKEESESARLAPETAASARRSLRWPLLAALAVAVVAAATWLLGHRREPMLPAPQASPLTTYPGLEYYPSFSPDGNQLAFAWNGEKQDNWDIYVKAVGSGALLRLTTDPVPDEFPAWSPDGRQIAFSRAGAIFLISPLGGPERKLVDFEVSSPMSWSPDGKWIAAAQPTTSDRPGGIFLIPLEGRENVRITSRNQPLEDRSPAFSPDGRWLGFVSCAGGLSCDVQVLELSTGYAAHGEPRPLTRRGTYSSGLAWTPDGKALVHSTALTGGGAGRLWRVPLSESGEPQQLDSLGDGAWPAASRQGNRLAYSTYQLDRDVWISEVSAASGGPRKLISSTRDDWNAEFSPDGRRIAFASNRSGISEIWVANRDGSHPVQLTSSQRDTGTPRWSPDGRWIVYDALTADGNRDVLVIDSSGGRPRRLVEHPAQDRVPSWSRDGKFIYFTSNRNAGKDEIFRVPASGGEPVQITDQGGYVAFESADGRTLYYTKTGQVFTSSPLFARPLSGGPERQVLDSVYDRAFAVTAGRIYYIERAGEDGKFPLKFFEFSSGRSRLLNQIESRPSFGLSVSPDGRQVLYSIVTVASADLVLVENFR